MSRVRFRSALLACVLSVGTVLVAAPMPADAPAVSITARDQPIAAFLRDLFGQIGRPVVTSTALTGTINGVFTGPGDRVFRDVSRSFNLASYYDGSAVYVYPASELATRIFTLGRGQSGRVVGSAANMRLTDAQNTLRASADGTLIASGTPRFLDQVDGLARSAGGSAPAPLAMDGGSARSSSPIEFRVFYLRYARAEDTVVNAGGREVKLQGVASMLRALVMDPRESAMRSGAGSRPVRQSANRLGGQGLNSVAAEGDRTGVLGLPPGIPVMNYADQGGGGAVVNGGGGNGGGGDSYSGYVPDPDATRIEASPSLNAVIVRDTRERMAAYEGLVRAIDIEPQLVEIEATIIDINTQKLQALGINWRFSSGGFGALFGSGNPDGDLRLNSRPELDRRRNQEAVTQVAQGLAISTVIGSAREFIARINALEARGAARIVSRPQVMTLSNIEAVFDRTRTFYVRVQGAYQVDLFNVTSGTTLRVNPHVFRDQNQTRIRCIIDIQDGSLTGDIVDGIPIVERASVNTQAMILAGESLLLGGLTVDEDVDATTKIPLLGDIPVLGNLFKNKRKERNRVERLFLITPRLATLTPRGAAAGASAGAGVAGTAPILRDQVPATSVPSRTPVR